MEQLHKQILVLFSIPVYAVFIPLEILLSNFRHLHFYSWKETLVNVYLNLLNAGIDMLLRLFVGLALLSFFHQYHFAISWNPIVYWVVLLFGEDLLFWLEHYVDHSCRLFWAVHVTHHSSPEYNLSTGFRSSVFMPVYKYLYFIPLVLLNFRPLDAIFMYSFTQVYGILVHTLTTAFITQATSLISIGTWAWSLLSGIGCSAPLPKKCPAKYLITALQNLSKNPFIPCI